MGIYFDMAETNFEKLNDYINKNKIVFPDFVFMSKLICINYLKALLLESDYTLNNSLTKLIYKTNNLYFLITIIEKDLQLSIPKELKLMILYLEKYNVDIKSYQINKDKIEQNMFYKKAQHTKELSSTDVYNIIKAVKISRVLSIYTICKIYS